MNRTSNNQQAKFSSCLFLKEVQKTTFYSQRAREILGVDTKEALGLLKRCLIKEDNLINIIETFS